MSQHPRWNVYDTGYSIAGVLIAAYIWAIRGIADAVWITLLLVVTYVAGRAAGSHR